MKSNEEVLETVVLCSLQQDSFHSVLVYISHVYIYKNNQESFLLHIIYLYSYF